MRRLIFFIGFVGVLLGGLWLVQGLGLVHIRPILCFADCAPIQGVSAMWAVIGAVVFTVGAVAMVWSFRRRAV